VRILYDLFSGGGGGGSTSKTETQTTNIDERVTSEKGNILNLGKSSFQVYSGGELQMILNDPSSAVAAIEAMGRQSTATIEAVGRQGEKVLSAAGELARGSNEIAREVAKSQEQFVATASGQSSVVKTVAVVGGLGLLVLLLPKFLKEK